MLANLTVQGHLILIVICRLHVLALDLSAHFLILSLSLSLRVVCVYVCVGEHRFYI